MFSIRLSTRHLVKVAAILILAIPAIGSATTVRMQTTLGAIDIILYDNAAPRTVANFLSYVNSGAYKNSFFHRSVPGFIVQGGGFVWNDASGTVSSVVTHAPIAHEYSPGHSNRRGMIGMAKLPGDPDSATSEWFINLADNSSTLDSQNGGFTVFGEVSPSSMTIVDRIARLPTINAGPAFGELPISGPILGGVIQKSNLAVADAALAVANNYQGVWWNPNEPGWGLSLTQHGNIILGALYTYDESGQPTWYVIPNCQLINSQCTGDIFKVTGGTTPVQPWTGTVRLAYAGTGTLDFAGTGNATFNYTIDNVAGVKTVSKLLFASGTTEPAIDYTDLWWNPNESGWGISITHQSGTVFAAWYTYDAAGKPVWYVVPQCPVSAASCTGAIYQVTGGASIHSVWNGTNPPTSVGSATFLFGNANTSTLKYTIDGVSDTRDIVRQVF